MLKKYMCNLQLLLYKNNQHRETHDCIILQLLHSVDTQEIETVYTEFSLIAFASMEK